MANTRVKVRREVLIEKIAAERTRVIEGHHKAVEKAASEQAAYAKQLDRALRGFIDLLDSQPEKAMKRVSSSWDREDGRATDVRFPGLEPPSKPSDAPKTHKLDRMLAVLRAAEDETLSIAAQDEYANYL